MPYIITTERMHAVTATPGCDDWIVKSRLAVATLDEGRQALRPFLPTGVADTYPVPDGLGATAPLTFGPSPDGTVIEVKEWHGNSMRSWAHFYGPGGDASVVEIIDAFNAASGQGS